MYCKNILYVFIMV